MEVRTVLVFTVKTQSGSTYTIIDDAGNAPMDRSGVQIRRVSDHPIGGIAFTSAWQEVDLLTPKGGGYLLTQSRLVYWVGGERVTTSPVIGFEVDRR